MKVVKINDNLKINIEQIYSLERKDNKYDIENWEYSYKNHLEYYTKNPITLQISDNKIFKPEFGSENNEEDLSLYAEALNNHIIDIIGEKPSFIENFYIILITGLKINISKDIYDKVDKYLDKFLLK